MGVAQTIPHFVSGPSTSHHYTFECRPTADHNCWVAYPVAHVCTPNVVSSSLGEKGYERLFPKHHQPWSRQHQMTQGWTAAHDASSRLLCGWTCPIQEKRAREAVFDASSTHHVSLCRDGQGKRSCARRLFNTSRLRDKSCSCVHGCPTICRASSAPTTWCVTCMCAGM